MNGYREWSGRILLVVLAVLLATPHGLFAQCDVPDGCPLPKDGMKFKDAGTPGPKGGMENQNSTDKTGSALKETVCSDNVDSDLAIIQRKESEPPSFEIKEDEEQLKVDFELPFPITAWKENAKDCHATAKKEDEPWSPLEHYHKAYDQADAKIGSEQFQWKQGWQKCWFENKGGHEWVDDPYWYIDKSAHAYHFDAPTHYGTRGGVGDNPEEKDKVYSGADGKVPDAMTYVVPSVPYLYMISSVLTAQWKWGKQAKVKNKHQYDHTGKIDRIPPPYGDGRCDICGAPMSLQTDYGYVDIKIEGKKPEEFYDGAVVNQPPQKPPAEYHCPKGVSASIYDPEHNLQFQLPDQDAVICRASVRVLDTNRITFVSFGDGNDAVWKAECGKKITDTDNHKVQFSLYDNAPHMRYKTVIEEGLKRQGDTWDVEKNFKAIFWYEDIVYDYVGYKNPALGLGEVFYTPKFYLKKGAVWEGVDGFARFTGNEPQVKACRDSNKDDPPNPQYVEWVLEFDTKELFAGQGGEDEDIVTWHYGDKALGDQFGNPRWEDGDYDGEPFNSYESICDKVKNKPVHFVKGRGPLKCFFEIAQCSDAEGQNTPGGSKGGGHKELIADGKQYFFPNDQEGPGKYHKQTGLNPNQVKHMQEPATKTVEGGAQIDPTQGGADLKKVDYNDVGDNWQNNAEIKGGGDKNLYQKFGRIEIVDKVKPGVGLRIYNKSSQKYREIYYRNCIDRLEFYDDVAKGGGQKATLRNDESNGDKLYPNDDDTWKFENMPSDLGQGETDLEGGRRKGKDTASSRT